MTVSIWQANDTQPVRDVEVLIVGAGLIGCTAAYFAARAGHQVTITEMRDVALGASSRNAGFMITGLDTYYHHAISKWGHTVVREMWSLSRHTHNLWWKFAEAGNVPIARVGSLLLAESEAEAHDLELAAQAMQADQLPSIYHANDPLKRGYYAAIEQPWDGAVQPYELTCTILQQSGAELINNNELYALEQTHTDWVLVKTRQFRFRARHVLLCTNAYSVHIDPYFVGKVIPTRAQVLATAPLPKSVFPTLGYSDYGYMYYRETFDGRLLLGGGRKQNKPAEHDTTDDRTTYPVQTVLNDYLARWFPDVTVPVERRWAGIMGFSVDGLPLVGTLPHAPRVGFAVGFTGHGLAMGGGTAERAVKMLLDGDHPGPLSADRFNLSSA